MTAKSNPAVKWDAALKRRPPTFDVRLIKKLCSYIINVKIAEPVIQNQAIFGMKLLIQIFAKNVQHH